MKTVHVVVKGRVQGVSFRYYTQKQARDFNLTGWVRNKADGSVETVLHGAEEDISAMLAWLKQGSPMARVDNLFPSEITAGEKYSGFEVR